VSFISNASGVAQSKGGGLDLAALCTGAADTFTPKDGAAVSILAKKLDHVRSAANGNAPGNFAECETGSGAYA
jgi:hypothetical protein